LVLSLLPLDPGEVVGRREPGFDPAAELRLPPQARREGELGELDAEAPTQLPQRAELVQLAQAVEPVARRAAPRQDEPGLLEVAEHPRRPAGLGSGAGHGEAVHDANPITAVLRLRLRPAGPEEAGFDR